VDDENRRFWVIPLADSLSQIDIPLLQQERDGIWASALLEYRYGGLFPLLSLLWKTRKQTPRNAGALWSLLVLMPPGGRWWPTPEESAAIALLNQEFKELDSWQDPIENWIAHREWVSNYEILTELFTIEPGQIKRADDMRVGKILTNLGWTKETRKELPDENGVMRFRRVRLNPTLNNLAGKVGKDGKRIALPESYGYRPLKTDGKVGSPVKTTNQPTSNYRLPTSETQSQQGIYQATDKYRQLSYSGNGGEWKPANGNLREGVWIVTRNRVRAWVSCPSPLGGAWLCLSENGEDLQVSEGEILWVWEESVCPES
jgi:predicted P-loop ATPase